ncbi:phosphatase PAP2 family protein [Streptomyces hesseae]|uniref:Phosphatase PAP2 family protein n=1 Tax=Streptomyces hesseae TaxID=3075519 RepID=A0ABU2SUB1_9ACTN|nr:phosphatase PAP2 family protein [Streptomyces sp. DSM 40473]MDT0452591.1 phosphatase PAP2 family protein [Streptomyces sp. DSM 40473]
MCVVLFALVTWQVAAHGPLRALDERLGRTVAGAGAVPSWGAEFLADLGNTVVAVPVLLAAVVFAAVRGRRWRPPVAAALAMVAVPLLVVPLKWWIGRAGPPAMGAGPHDGFFPSGHAATAAVAYGAAALLVFRRWWWVAPYVLLNLGVGLGLVRQGYHWPLDVVGAWCLAGVVLWVQAGGRVVPTRPALRDDCPQRGS